jgi:hypothetical protein
MPPRAAWAYLNALAPCETEGWVHDPPGLFPPRAGSLMSATISRSTAKVGGDDAAAHVAVSQLKNPQFEHLLGGSRAMFDSPSLNRSPLE